MNTSTCRRICAAIINIFWRGERPIENDGNAVELLEADSGGVADVVDHNMIRNQQGNINNHIVDGEHEDQISNLRSDGVNHSFRRLNDHLHASSSSSTSSSSSSSAMHDNNNVPSTTNSQGIGLVSSSRPLLERLFSRGVARQAQASSATITSDSLQSTSTNNDRNPLLTSSAAAASASSVASNSEANGSLFSSHFASAANRFGLYSDPGSAPVIPSLKRSKSLEEKMKEYEDLYKHLPTHANFLVPGSVLADTRDNEDHTFCGIMFDLECKTSLPIEFIEIQGIAVRGELGPLGVYITPVSYQGKRDQPSLWQQVYKGDHPESMHQLVELKLQVPLRLAPSMSLGVYVHSQRPGDGAIVYDNRYYDGRSYEDPFIKIYTGCAHLSNRPFSNVGFFGPGWRERREFVGRVRFGVQYLLWNPETHTRFPKSFQTMVKTVLLCHNRKENPQFYNVPIVVLYQIFNMLPHDWAMTDEEIRGNKEDGSSKGGLLHSLISGLSLA